MRGRMFSASRDSYRLSISCRPIDSAGGRGGDGAGVFADRCAAGAVVTGRDVDISNFTGHPSLTFRAGFVEVAEARSDWAPDPANPLPKFSPPRRVPHGVTLIGRLFDEGTLGRVGIAMERAFNVASARPTGF